VAKALGDDWKNKLSPLGVDYLTIDDRLVALSAGAVYAGNLWINKDLFDQYNLTPPKTYDEWKSVCAEFKRNNVGCFVQGANQGAFNIDTFHAIANQVNPGVFDKALALETQWTDPDLVQAAKYWKALFDDGIMQDGAAGLMQYPEANNMFLSGQYAMVMMGTWYTMYNRPDDMKTAMEAAGVSNPEPFTIMPIDLPDMAGKGNTGIMFGDADYGVGVSANTKNAAAAKSFALWLGTSDAGQQTIADSLNLIPARIGITPNWDNITLVNPDVQAQAVQDLFAKAGEADQSRFGNINADMNDALVLALSSIATGTATPEDAMAELQTQADSVG
jgi:ABC-type glycerol-3-phosphate transport system substrate-binding protein